VLGPLLFFVCFVCFVFESTQLARQIHQERTQMDSFSHFLFSRHRINVGPDRPREVGRYLFESPLVPCQLWPGHNSPVPRR